MHRRQLCRDKLDTPVRSKRGARAELAKTARGKGRKVVTQQGGTLLPGEYRGSLVGVYENLTVGPKRGRSAEEAGTDVLRPGSNFRQ